MKDQRKIKVKSEDKQRINLYSFQMRKRPTKAELAMRDLLKELEISHIFQKRLLWYIADFYLTKDNKKTIVEVDGEYHYTPEQRKYDERRDGLLRSSGYRMIRFTNKEVLEAPDKVKKDLVYKYGVVSTPRKRIGRKSR